jgi:hypothetical protein
MRAENDLLGWISESGGDKRKFRGAHDWYLIQLPRIVYLKNLPENTVLLDVGAGDGSLILFKDWLAFPRPDLVFVGLSLETGVHTGRYDEFQVCDLDSEKPALKNKPTAIIACQLIEHVKDYRELLKWFFDLLPSGGTVFIDWPSSHTVDLPSREVFASKGFNITTLNFFDDHTHKNALSTDEVVSAAKAIGFSVINQGMVDMPYLADRLRDEGRMKDDGYLLSMAMWLKTNFVSYCTFKKP